MGDLCFYTDDDLKNFNFYKFPKALFSEPEYRGISDSAKILYMIFYDRMFYSHDNRYIDDLGMVYIHYSIKEVMEELGWSREKVKRALYCLEENELICLSRKKVGTKYRIYVSKMDKSKESKKKKRARNESTLGSKRAHPYSNTNNFNNNNITKTNNINKSACARVTQTNSKSKDKNRAVGDSS